MSKTDFSDGSQPQGIYGTIVNAAFLDVIFNHRHDNVDEDGHAPLDYAADTGAANAYVITLPGPALTGHIPGLPIFWKAANANTGASTINVNGLGAVALRKWGGSPLATGDIAAGQINVMFYDGTYYQILPGMVAARGGSSTQVFSAADGTGGKQVINISQFGASLGANGYQRLPNGFIIQWVMYNVTAQGTGHTVSWPTTFPTACAGAVATFNTALGIVSDQEIFITERTTSQFTIATVQKTGNVFVIGLGY